MIGYVTTARPVALLLVLASFLPSTPAQVVIEDPVPVPAAPPRAAPVPDEKVEKDGPVSGRVYRGARCIVRAGEGVPEPEMAAAAKPADWALGELERLLGKPLPTPLVIRLHGPSDVSIMNFQPGSFVLPTGEGTLAAAVAAPAIPRGGELIHELTHHCVGVAVGAPRTDAMPGGASFPRLLNEGLAEALRWRWVGEANGGSRDNLGHLRLVRAAPASQARRGVHEILSFSGYASRLRAEDASHFAHGWALASFLLERPQAPACLRAVVEGVRGGADGTAAFDAAVRAAFHESPEVFEAAWRRWVDERWEGVLREARKALDGDPAKAESARRDAAALGDADYGKREAASRRLVDLGDAAIPLVQPLLEHEDAEVRARARAVLDRLLEP